MGKAKIYASGNERLTGDFNISYYIIEKDKHFLDWLGQLLIEVLGDEGGVRKVKFVNKILRDEGGLEIGKEIYEKDIEKMIDVHEKYGEKGDRVDLFYGERRVYITFRKSRETRDKFARFILKTKEWIKLEEVNRLKFQQLPFYASKKVN